jgi:4-hydroxyphenylacetate 3-monooxygenase
MRPRNGNDYLTSVRDSRNVFIDGERVTDITTHPAFRESVHSYAALYDFQCVRDNLDLMTFETPTGRRVNRAWLLPPNREQLVERRHAIEAWARLSFGLLGRSPDHVATSLGGMVAGLDALSAYGGVRAHSLRDYFGHVRDNDLFVSYVINNPQADKSKSASEQRDGDLVLSVVAEDADGIVVRGAKMLGTSAVMADELFVGNVAPLRADEARYASSFAVPLATPGLKLLSRKSYEAAAPNGFDYPLSYRFDENDALVWFENVRVPWSRVFLHGDVDAARAQWHATPAHAYHNYQAQIRFSIKLRFLSGLAKRVAQVNGSSDIPAVKTILSRIARQSSMVDGMVLASETAGRFVGGYYFPSADHAYAGLSFAQEIYPEVITDIRRICGGGVIMLPSSAKDFGNPELAQLIEATQVSSVVNAEGRVKVFRLAWDAVGSEFASRHTQYEMFYGGASSAVDANVYRTYDWDSADRLVDAALDLMGSAKAAAQSSAPELTVA